MNQLSHVNYAPMSNQLHLSSSVRSCKLYTKDFIFFDRFIAHQVFRYTLCVYSLTLLKRDEEKLLKWI